MMKQTHATHINRMIRHIFAFLALVTATSAAEKREFLQP